MFIATAVYALRHRKCRHHNDAHTVSSIIIVLCLLN